MLRRYFPLLALILAALACNAVGGGNGQPTEAVRNVATSAAETATALVTTPATPTEEGAPSATPEGAASATPEGAATAEPTTDGPPSAEPTAGPAAPTCAVTYTDFVLDLVNPVNIGNVYCLGADGTPQVLASGNRPYSPSLSPDGTLIAYQVVVGEGITQLWIVSAAGGDARLLVGQDQLPSADGSVINSPQSYEWLAGTHTLVFDTRYLPIGGPFGPGEYINADLWTVNADTNVVTTLLGPGAAGRFSVSPDGQTIAIARPEGLDLLNADGSNYRQNVISFPAILTYSEYAYKPFPQWMADGLFFEVSIPSPDPLAADAHADLYRIGVDGVVQALTTIPANVVFGGAVTPPLFSPNGQFVFYSVGLPDGTGEVLHQLEFLAEGGVGERSLGPTLGLSGWGWSPDSVYFAYSVTPEGAPGQGYVTGTAAESVQPFANGLTFMRTFEWENGTTLLFIGKIGPSATWSLYRQTLGSEPVLLAGGLTNQATLDVLN